jgi:Zn finger protein HypA/HybF involved in hydrogenase expression
MLYKFKCKKCRKIEFRSINIEDYDKEKNKQLCQACGQPMERVIEWTGTATINGGYEAVAGRAKWQQ